MNDLKNVEATCVELLDEELADASGGKTDSYLKIDGIQGESQQASHRDWIELLSWNH
jgi:type VI protein secretion system component Hcp